ncbi:hypothetical protein [uncultured Flavobacterium sp.]|uniref:hypothetical protein n=1 Tax=uncultured Flavobacterium sp. TaxID=165435 RepID=UPI0030C88ECB
MITTKRNFLKFYLSISFAFLFFNALGTFMIYTYFDLINKGKSEIKTLFMLLFGIAVILMAFYTVWQYFRNSPTIKIDNHKITFNKNEYLISDIKKVYLTGKMPFKYLITFPMEGTRIKFKDNSVKYFFNDMYQNSWEIKYFLQKVVIEKGEFSKPENNKIEPKLIRFIKSEDFKGNQWTSLRGISLWGLIFFFLFMVFSKGKVSTNINFWIGFLVFSFFWFYFNSWLMHYFSLDKDFLIIKNHNLIWKQDIYKISNIKEVTFETQGKMPNCLRVIEKNFKEKLYPAGTLSDEKWIEFKLKLEKNGVKVRNECIYEE